MEHAMTYFADIELFLQENQDVAPRNSGHLQVLLTDVERRKRLMMELAAVVDAGGNFVKATYQLESDGLLVFSAYSTLQGLSTAAAQQHYPNVEAQAQSLGETPQEKADLRKIARDGVRPGITYFLHKFNVQFYNVVTAFKIARYACPVRVQQLKPTPEEVSALRVFPFLDNDGLIAGLQKELPPYMAEAEGVRLQDGEQMVWWYNHRQCLPSWSAAARLLSLVQPSSASAERVFSLLQAAFNDQQSSTLTDELEASVMLAYNHRSE